MLMVFVGMQALMNLNTIIHLDPDTTRPSRDEFWRDMDALTRMDTTTAPAAARSLIKRRACLEAAHACETSTHSGLFERTMAEVVRELHGEAVLLGLIENAPVGRIR